MQRTVEQRERRALAGAGQSGAFDECLPPLDVCRRERAKGARNLGECEVREMARLERPDPRLKSFVANAVC